MTRIGTSYFVSRAAAIAYYSDYVGEDASRVDRKIAEGEIHIGKPPLKPGESLFLLDNRRRYGVEPKPEPLTREWYMAFVDSEDMIARHRDYYGQIADEMDAISYVPRDMIDACRAAGPDNHYNEIPLPRWDALASNYAFASRARAALKARGTGMALSDVVCIAKEAVRRHLSRESNEYEFESDGTRA